MHEILLNKCFYILNKARKDFHAAQILIIYLFYRNVLELVLFRFLSGSISNLFIYISLKTIKLSSVYIYIYIYQGNTVAFYSKEFLFKVLALD